MVVLEEKFWRTVPPRDDVVRKIVRFFLLVDVPCKAKIANFEIEILVDEDVPRFHITVDDSTSVNVRETAQTLVHVVLYGE